MSRRRYPRWLNVAGWLSAALWGAFLVLQSGSPSVGGFLARILARFPAGADKIGHASAYAVLGGLLTLATGRPWLAVLLATLFGISDEIHQYFVPGRHADVLDVAADAVGALIGALVVAFLSRQAGRRT
ncbi:MAG: VanZ family protein [Trueperaceae bacterium]